MDFKYFVVSSLDNLSVLNCLIDRSSLSNNHHHSFGPIESKKAMMYSDVGRLNFSESYTTFATPVRGQVCCLLAFQFSYISHLFQSTKSLDSYSFQGVDNKEYSSMLHKALEGAVMLHTFPKTTVNVFALVLESGGSMILFNTILLAITIENWIYYFKFSTRCVKIVSMPSL
jgi:hypothetical protein